MHAKLISYTNAKRQSLNHEQLTLTADKLHKLLLCLAKNPMQ